MQNHSTESENIAFGYAENVEILDASDTINTKLSRLRSHLTLISTPERLEGESLHTISDVVCDAVDVIDELQKIIKPVIARALHS